MKPPPWRIYLAECPSEFALKVGVSRNPERRVADLKYGTKRKDWRLVHHFPTPWPHPEFCFHRRLADYRHPGFAGREYYFDMRRVRAMFKRIERVVMVERLEK